MHVHTVLSPCGGLDMSPSKIIDHAVREKIDILAITDHNSTKHCGLAQELGKRKGITVLAGAELNTMEEIHCLAIFENIDKAGIFQQFIDRNLNVVNNKPDLFGYQVIVDEDEQILAEEDRLLVASLKVSVHETEKMVHDLGGIFIPAHINRPYNSIYSQLGFLPSELKADALEISRNANYEMFIREHPELSGYKLITNSDAHHGEQIGRNTTDYYLKQPEFEEIAMALKDINGRKVKTI